MTSSKPRSSMSRPALPGRPRLPPTWRSTTGRGAHLFLRHPGGPVRNGVHVMPGLDIRGDAGYVVAPPSQHATGRRYAWHAAPWDAPLAPMPGWLRDRLAARDG